MVVGETARAANWGLSGYTRDTTPELARRQVLNWSNVTSCGTSTRESVPCMFSHLGKEDFEGRKFEYENLMDVLQAAGLGTDTLPGSAWLYLPLKATVRTRGVLAIQPSDPRMLMVPGVR